MTRIPDHATSRWQQHFEAGIRAFKAGRAQEAVQQLNAAARARPQDANVRYWLANACRQAGDVQRSETLFRQLVSERSTEQTVFGLAFLLRDQGRLAEAGDAMARLSQQPALSTDALLRIAGFLRDINLFSAAIEVMQRVIAEVPGDAASRLRLSRLLQAEGRFDEAIEQARHALDLDSELGGAWLTLAQLQKFSTTDHPDLSRLRSAGAMLAGEEARMCHGFALAKACDDLGDYAAAWQAAVEANTLAARTWAWDREAWDALVRRKLCSTGEPQDPPATAGRHVPVYIIGMLRSGTTLLEQRLGRYAGVRPRGELNFLARADREQAPVPAARDQLWAHLQQGDTESRVFIDKNPLNFRFLDTLYRLIPDARVIHVRRDGRNSCLSCFLQLFQHDDAAFANRLEDLARVYRDYRRLVRHWHDCWPGRILEVRYEDLVTDTQNTLMAVLNFLDLPASITDEESVDRSSTVRTASAWQARQAIYRDSLEKWENYRVFAPGFFDAIAAIDAEFELNAGNSRA